MLNGNDEKQSPMSDADRLELAAKLDRELDEFIDGLEKKQYTDGWPEDRWEEEMDKHPFFAKKSPAPGEELSPLMEGLQQLKYDPESNTLEELAVKYKDDGNFDFKHKNYRLAILSYTEGIKLHCGCADIEAALYNNRAAAHYFLKNYRSALRDSQAALKLNPEYSKARWRTAQCAYHLSEHEMCAEICDEILQRNRTDKDALELRKKTLAAKATRDRDIRKKSLKERQQEKSTAKLKQALGERKIKFYNEKKDVTSSMILEIPRPRLAPLADHPVHLDNEDTLVWPVAFLYPEYLVTEFLQQVSELTKLEECLEELFCESPDWDKKREYHATNVNAYYENRSLGKYILVNKECTLKQILSLDSFIVYEGTPTFNVVPVNSTTEKELLKRNDSNWFQRQR